MNKTKTVYVPKHDFLRLENTKDVRYRGIGFYRDIYKPKPCKYTRWVEELYSPKYNDPAYVYAATKAYKRTAKEASLQKHFLNGVTVVVFMCILAIVFK